jgi:uncharacterized protein (TIGR00730 family)
LALPGGIGTFEEFFEAWTWRQLGFHDKPVGLLNTHGHYDAMLSFMQSTVKNGFVSDWQMDLIKVHTQVESLLQDLLNATGTGLAPGSNRI